MSIIRYFKKLRKRRKLKKLEKGILCAGRLLDEMVDEGRLTHDEAVDRLTTIIWACLDETTEAK